MGRIKAGCKEDKRNKSSLAKCDVKGKTRRRDRPGEEAFNELFTFSSNSTRRQPQPLLKPVRTWPEPETNSTASGSRSCSSRSALSPCEESVILYCIYCYYIFCSLIFFYREKITGYHFWQINANIQKGWSIINYVFVKEWDKHNTSSILFIRIISIQCAHNCSTNKCK